MESGQRVVVYVPQEQHRQLKAVLAGQGKTVSSWFREQVLFFLGSGITSTAHSFYRASGEKPKKISAEPEQNTHPCDYPNFKCSTPGVIKKGSKWFCLAHIDA